jgi:hypothetical protein
VWCMDMWVEDEAHEFMECGWHMSWMGRLYSSGGGCLFVVLSF